jgi:nicotinamide-nucleotide amidase
MRAEVISIGDELTSGTRLDTNSQWLSQRLEELGATVLFHTTVGDDLAANIDVFRKAASRVDVVVVSGGLGPTADDLTRQALADAAGVDLVLDQPSLDHIVGLFARRGRAMPPANEIQAMFPRGAKAIPNPHGSAPGIDFRMACDDRPGARFFCLPGVPAEMKEMWSGTVADAVAAMAPAKRVIQSKNVKCFGVGESDLEAMLPDLIRRGREPRVGITVSKATITLRITAIGPDAATCLSQIDDTERTIRACLGQLVFGQDDDELQHAVARRMIDQGQRLAVWECGTTGLIAHWLGELPEAREFFAGAIVEPGAQAPSDGLDAWLADRARETRARFGAAWSLAVGPFPKLAAHGETPAPVWFALDGPEGTKTTSLPFAGHPDILRARFAKAALNLARLG